MMSQWGIWNDGKVIDSVGDATKGWCDVDCIRKFPCTGGRGIKRKLAKQELPCKHIVYLHAYTRPQHPLWTTVEAKSIGGTTQRTAAKDPPVGALPP